jgi:hypothetical protein
MAFAPLFFFMSNGADMGALNTFKKICWQEGPTSLLSRLMNKVWCLIACTLLPMTGVGQVSFNLDAELLKDNSGNPMGLSGLVILAASGGDNVFTPPSASAFFTGDDFELGRWDLNSGFMTPGVFQIPTTTFNPSSSFTGDVSPVQLYWFPSLTTGSASPGLGTHYGTFTDAVGHNGSDPWTMPADAFPRTLKFATKDATGTLFAPGEGFFDPSAGNASLTVVPEPSFYACIIGLGCLGWAVIARRIRSSVLA